MKTKNEMQRKYLDRIFGSYIIENVYSRRGYISENVGELAKLRGESEEYVLLSIKDGLEEQIEAGAVPKTNLSKVLIVDEDLTEILKTKEEVHA